MFGRPFFFLKFSAAYFFGWIEVAYLPRDKQNLFLAQETKFLVDFYALGSEDHEGQLGVPASLLRNKTNLAIAILDGPVSSACTPTM